MTNIKYEYYIAKDLYGIKDEITIQRLNELGSDGWELCAIEPAIVFFGFTFEIDTKYIFKRIKP